MEDSMKNINFTKLNKLFDGGLKSRNRYLIPNPKLVVKEKLNNSSSLIRDECGRVVVLEKYQYEDKRLISTTVHSPHGLVLARQDFIHLEENQVLMKFFDSEGKLVFEEILRANN